jgi:hypothetical protein
VISINTLQWLARLWIEHASQRKQSMMRSRLSATEDALQLPLEGREKTRATVVARCGNTAGAKGGKDFVTGWSLHFGFLWPPWLVPFDPAEFARACAIDIPGPESDRLGHCVPTVGVQFQNGRAASVLQQSLKEQAMAQWIEDKSKADNAALYRAVYGWRCYRPLI